MSVMWYVRRFRAMNPREVLHRVSEQGKRAVSRRRHYGWDTFPPSSSVRAVPGLADRFGAAASDALKAAIWTSADRLLEGKFSAHGVAWPQRGADNLFPSELWRLDPVTRRLWPGADVYCFDLAYRHERKLGDIKYVWDLNRLQFLQPLAATVALFEDSRALAAIEQAIVSWADCNAPFKGLGWTSGIELALRGITLTLVVGLCGERLSDTVRDRISQILAAHLYWLNRYPSHYSSANNHLVAELMGKFVIASVLPDAPRAREIRTHARAALEAEAALQILPDGTPAEQSPTYGAFTVEMLLVADLVARAMGNPLAPIIAERSLAFAEMVGAFATDGGNTPSVGDDDEGRVLTLSNAHEHHYPVSVARAVAGHFRLPPRLPPSADAPELRDGFFPATGAVQRFADGLRSLTEGGYTVVRETRAGCRLHLVMDHGPLGYLSIAAHGHADANAIVVTLNDQPLLVDPGTYLYHSGGVWRDWFRGTGSHNTLRLEGVDQSVIAGAFNWSHKADARLDHARPGPEWSIVARHEGYRKRFGVEHQRRVSATATGIALEDRLLGGDASKLVGEVIFQFACGLSVEQDGEGVNVCGLGLPPVRLSFSRSGTLEIKSGGDHPGEGGWVSPRFGTKVPAPRLVWRGAVPAQGLRTSVDWA